MRRLVAYGGAASAVVLVVGLIGWGAGGMVIGARTFRWH